MHALWAGAAAPLHLGHARSIPIQPLPPWRPSAPLRSARIPPTAPTGVQRDPPDRSSNHQTAAAASTAPVTLGQTLELECQRLAVEGKGVCLVPPTGFVVLVARTLPGERVVAQVTEVKKGYAEARKLASLSPHRNAVQPPCPYFGPCGGCTLQSLSYDAQLAEKRNQVEQMLRRVGRLGEALAALPGGGVSPAVGAEQLFGYRNKMMFHFSSKCWEPREDRLVNRPVLGLLRPGSQDEVLPVTQHGCLLQDGAANALLARVSQLVQQQLLLPYNDPSGKGCLKTLTIRKGSGQVVGQPHPQQQQEEAPAGGGEYMVVFGMTQGPPALLQPLADVLAKEFPQLVSIVAKRTSLTATAQPSTNWRPPSGQGAGGGGSRGGREGSGSRGWRGGREDGDGRGWRGGRGGRDGYAYAGSRQRIAQPRQWQQGASPPGDAAGGADGEEDLTGFAEGGAAAAAVAGADAGSATVLHGRPYIYDRLCGLTFQVSHRSFFQTNSSQAEVLYKATRTAAALRPDGSDAVLDLYCGTGSIGLTMADGARSVYGYENVSTAVADAVINAELNGVRNATFACADLDTPGVLQRCGSSSSSSSNNSDDGHGGGGSGSSNRRSGSEHGSGRGAAAAAKHHGNDGGASGSMAVATAVATAVAPTAAEAEDRSDVVIADPARAGMSPAVLDYLLSRHCTARRLVYVSCNVATQARDLGRLCNGPGAGWRLASVTPFDMFPHTDHVETVAILERI